MSPALSDTPAAPPPLLRVSLVTYRPQAAALLATLESLRLAVEALQAAMGKQAQVELVVVHNGGDLDEAAVRGALAGAIPLQVLRPPRNLGFGAAHNLALAASEAQFHLVLNPDVLQAQDALLCAVRWFQAHPEAVLLAPDVCDAAGERSYLCRRKPSPFVLALRAFAPSCVKRIFLRSLARYEMRDCVDGVTTLWDPPLLSGCYMFFRASAWRAVQGFDPRYFLYFEDYDLSLRMARHGRLAYVPQVRIVHFGGGAARKGWRHIRMFVASAWRFYCRHGWRA